MGKVKYLLVGEGDAAVGPIETFVYSWITFSQSMDADKAPEAGGLGWSNVVAECSIDCAVVVFAD